MTFILGSVLFLLGGFFGMLIMSLSVSVRDTMERDTTLRIVKNND